MNESLKHQLFRAKTYREFLRQVFKAEGTDSGGGLTYSLLSRRAGFASRSYPREVTIGRRRITAKTLPQFVRGLKLSGYEKAYFTWLVAKDEPEINSQGLSREEIDLKLGALKKKMMKRTTVASAEQAKSFLRSRHVVDIYAALGGPDNGRTLREIAALTRHSEITCASLLNQMLREGMIVERDSRYSQSSEHMSLEGLGGSDFFRNYFLQTLSDMQKRAPAKFESDENLYFTSVFSIKRGRASDFKHKLRKLVLEFVEEAEDPTGDSLARIGIIFEGN